MFCSSRSRRFGLAYTAAHHHGSSILLGAHEPAGPTCDASSPELLIHLPHRGLRGQDLGHLWKVAAPGDEESIVYRFGILLLEVISGRLPLSEDHGLLVLWASSYLDGKRPLNGMADPMLRSSVRDKDLAVLCDVVRLCIHSDKDKRPAMAEVARLMRGATAVSPEQATPRDNPLWWAELEIASTTVESG